MRRPEPAYGAFLAALAVAAASCGPPAAQPIAKERVAVGVLAPFSGPGGPTLAVPRGVQVALAEYNSRAGSIYQAELARADTAGTPDGAEAAAEFLTGTERLVGVIGPQSAEEAATAGSVLERERIPFILPSVTSPVAEAGFANHRRLPASVRRQGALAAAEASRRAGGGQALLLHDGAPGSVEFIEGASEALGALGTHVIRTEALRERVDWGAAAARIAGEEANIVIHAGAGDRSGALLRSLRPAGYRGVYAASVEALSGSFGEWSGGQGEGAITVCACAAAADPRAAGFARAYRREFGIPPQPYALESYEGALMLLEAVQEVEAEPARVAEFLGRARSFLGDSKLYRFDERGEPVDPPVWLWQFGGGRWRWVSRLAG